MNVLLRRAPTVLALFLASGLTSGAATAQVASVSGSHRLRPTFEQPYGGARYDAPAHNARNELGRRSPYYPPAPIWAGLYAGVHAGYGWGHVDANDSALGSVSISGGLIGLHAGYNWQIDNVVAGIEGDLTAGWLDGHRGFASGYDMAGSHDWMSSVRLRLGYSFSNVLLYATGGLAFAKVNASLNDGLTTFSDSALQTGYVFGAGIETKLSQMMSVRAEVLHYGFGEKDFSFGGAAVPIRSDETVVRGGLSIHFN